jgi:phthalate 4,5-dioxygenase
MSRIMREFHQPDISYEEQPWGLQLTALRPMTEELTHVRITHSIFPNTFVIPLSETLTITQLHVPVDDERTYWYSFFTSFAGPVDREAMRRQRLQFISLPDYIPKSGRHDQWGFDPEEQRSRTFLGMGEEDINVHDQWAVESMGAIQDRSREHLGTSDKVIMANRRLLLQAIETVQAGGVAPGIADPSLAGEMRGPETVDGIAPAGTWASWWRERVQDKRAGAPWLAAAASSTEAQPT